MFLYIIKRIKLSFYNYTSLKMSLQKISNESDLNVTPFKTKEEIKDPNTSLNKSKDTRRFCEKWFLIFGSWLSRCAEDPDKPFCRACQRRLDNNRFRLQRHEKTAKHARNLEILLNSGEMAVIEYLSQRKKRKRQSNEGDTKLKRESKPNIFHTPDMESPHYESKFIYNKPRIPKKERCSPPWKPIEQVDLDLYYRSIEREQSDMDTSDYYFGTPPEKKDSFDMFFYAISSSVKSLPPKLAAEVKSRISQVIAEFELRSICEQEAQEKVDQSIISNQETSVIDTGLNVESNQKSTDDGTLVTQYVYSYQPKP